MSLWEIIAIAFGVSMDAFAVSVTLGLSVKKPGLKEILLPGVYFGAFQALMPTIGFFAGTYFAQKIQNFDHWIAFTLLVFVGAKMIKDSFSKETAGEVSTKEYAFSFVKMLVLALATSIDALTIGVTYAFFRINIVKAALLTGCITAALSMGGVKIGNAIGRKGKARAEFLGGAVLILLGVKIMAEHLLKTSGNFSFFQVIESLTRAAYYAIL